MRKRGRWTHWALIIAAALFFHVALLLCVRPSAFRFFAKIPEPPGHLRADGTLAPDAILSIPVELEEDFGRPLGDIEVQPPLCPAAPGPDSGLTPDLDMVEMLGEASRTRPQGPEIHLLQTPPRPLQITWPDARRPEHCLGHEITLRIQVGEDGGIREVKPEWANHPPDCVRAAVETTTRIVFAPGTVNGRPVTMWTRIRIEFRHHDGR